MIVDTAAVSSTDPVAAAESDLSVDAPDLRLFVFGLFFVFGGITSLNDVIIPKLKALFTLSYAQAMLVQSAFFAAYLLVSLPAASLVKRIGYMRGAVAGLLAMTAGCLLFAPASTSGRFEAFLLALFVLAGGITLVQVVSNPLISMLGKPATSHSRLTFAQAFNSLGTTIFPYVGSILILGSLSAVDPRTLTGAALGAFRADETRVVVRTYLGLAAALAIVAAVVWTRRKRLVEAPSTGGGMLAGFDLLKRPRFAFGALGIFLYVGAEVAVGSLIVNFLMQPDVLGLGPEAAGKRVPLYWGGAMIGRFVGAWVLRRVSPGKVLAGVAAASILLLATAATTHGTVSAAALLAIGLCNAVMFPTIFTLASAGLGRRAADGSGVLCVAIVGGALVPPLTGGVADLVGLRSALLVPAMCYAAILAFGLYTRRPVVSPAAA